MSAKLLHALTDENPDLQKQIGCMTGIFQLFDRHHILTAPKRVVSHSPKKLPAGSSHFSNGYIGGESQDRRNLHTDNKEKNLSKGMNENQRVSTESSRASFSSSSCSSSFSSVECNKAAQPEHPSFDRMKDSIQDVTSRGPQAYQPNASAQLGRQSPEFRDVVKDSIYREARGLSVRTNAKEEPASGLMKHRDSPRSLQISRSVDESLDLGINVKQNLKDSLRVLAKLREAPQYFNDARELPVSSSYEGRDGCLFSVPEDAPRFSYDGREVHRSSFESRDSLKSTIRLRDLPRLSLDSRESSIKDSKLNPKSDLILKDFHRGCNDRNRTLSTKPELECHKRHPSVVAKLMGLEAMPNSTVACEDQMGLSKANNLNEKKNKRVQSSTSGSPRHSLKEPVSPRLRSPDLSVKPVSSSWLPIEPAPWRQLGGSRGFQKSTLRTHEVTPRPIASSPSVYAEIEKRLKDLEFKQSDKGLRALKQILDAMQAKGLLEMKKEDDEAFLCERNPKNSNQNIIDQNVRLSNRQSPLRTGPVPSNLKRTSTPRTFDSPIVIMKPAKLIEKSGIPASSVLPIDGLSGLRKLRNSDSVDSKRGFANNQLIKDLTPKLLSNNVVGSTDKKVNGRTLRSVQTSTRCQQLPKENTGSSSFGRSSGSMSPRLQQKKLELERRARPPTHSSELSKPRRQSVKQQTESSSPGGKRRTKSPNLQQSDDQLSEISSETRNSSHQGDGISLQLDSNTSLASQMDIEVVSVDQSAETNGDILQQGGQCQSRKLIDNSTSSSTQKKTSTILNEGGAVVEFTSISPEQPSPVSVLDASFYKDDLTSPDRKVEKEFKDNETRNSDESRAAVGWKLVDVNHSSGIAGPNNTIEISKKKLENVENLVQKLKRLNSNHDEATTDYIAGLCENTNPDHRYISEILLASGLLLRDLGSGLTTIQLHASGHPINPDLFFVLEQTKASTELSKDKHSSEHSVRLKFDKEKFHRRLVFDAVNEILEQKLASVEPSSELWLRSKKLARKTLNAQQLLRELCLEIEQLQTNKTSDSCSDDDEYLNTILFKDVVYLSESWTDFPKEVPGIVLDVERSIFKELVDEIVSGEAMSLRVKPNRRRRQLFAK